MHWQHKSPHFHGRLFPGRVLFHASNAPASTALFAAHRPLNWIEPNSSSEHLLFKGIVRELQIVSHECSHWKARVMNWSSGQVTRCEQALMRLAVVPRLCCLREDEDHHHQQQQQQPNAWSRVLSDDDSYIWLNVARTMAVGITVDGLLEWPAISGNRRWSSPFIMGSGGGINGLQF